MSNIFRRHVILKRKKGKSIKKVKQQYRWVYVHKYIIDVCVATTSMEFEVDGFSYSSKENEILLRSQNSLFKKKNVFLKKKKRKRTMG